jgi:hypothetical protein
MMKVLQRENDQWSFETKIKSRGEKRVGGNNKVAGGEEEKRGG